MSVNDRRTVAYMLAEVTFKPHSEGGRQMMPVGSGYAPYLRTAVGAEDLAVRVNNVPTGAQFGEFITVTLELTYIPELDYGALEQDVSIQLIEGPKVVAVGFCKSAITTS